MASHEGEPNPGLQVIARFTVNGDSTRVAITGHAVCALEADRNDQDRTKEGGLEIFVAVMVMNEFTQAVKHQ